MDASLYSPGNRCIKSLDGVIITCFDYDETKDKRAGVELWVIAVGHVMEHLGPPQYSKEKLYDMFGKLDRIYKDGVLKKKTINPVFEEYGITIRV